MSEGQLLRLHARIANLETIEFWRAVSAMGGSGPSIQCHRCEAPMFTDPEKWVEHVAAHMREDYAGYKPRERPERTPPPGEPYKAEEERKAGQY